MSWSCCTSSSSTGATVMPSRPTDAAESSSAALTRAGAVGLRHRRRARERLQLDLERLPDAALPRHVHLDRLAGLAEGDLLLQLAHVLDRLAVHRDDDVARLEARPLGRRASPP